VRSGEFLVVVAMKTIVFWDMMLHSTIA